MSAPLIQLQSVTKEYTGRRVLAIGALEIPAGEIFSLVGPSGAGKSTLLRLINFLEPPSAGRIGFRGSWFGPRDEVPLQIRRRVTTVFQRPLLLNRDVWANVNLGLRLRQARDSRQATDQALSLVGLTDLARQPARSLSGGEAQRVALARAIALKPDVLLLDEPTANLDPYNAGLIEGIITQLNQQAGTTLLLVTHNIFQARRLAHRVGLILDGQIVEVADRDRFFESPADPRTRAFVRGDMVY